MAPKVKNVFSLKKWIWDDIVSLVFIWFDLFNLHFLRGGMGNFVNVIGYQFEKIHAGMIKWLLDLDQPQISKGDKCSIIRGFYEVSGKKIPFDLGKVNNIVCFREYSFGRRMKVDIVVKLDFFGNDIHYLVFELKVDSIPYENQLKIIKDTFSAEVVGKGKNVDADYFLVLLGSSFVCAYPHKKHGFEVVDLEKFISIFDFLKSKNKPSLLEDWLLALGEERDRSLNVERNIENISGPSLWDNAYWLNKNYRIYMPLFYYIYATLKDNHLSSGKDWSIYSGSNNPVMNWDQGWEGNDKFEFFWEFNFDTFLLKVWIDRGKVSHEELNDLRDKFYPICRQTTFTGAKTYRKYSEYNSVYKWSLDFKKMDFGKIASVVEDDILKIHPKLLRII